MNLPTYDQIKTMINLETAQPVSTEQWKIRVFYATIDAVKMMNGLNKEETKKEASDDKR